MEPINQLYLDKKNWKHFYENDKLYCNNLLIDYNNPNKPSFFFSCFASVFETILKHKNYAIILCNSGIQNVETATEIIKTRSDVFLIATSALMYQYLKSNFKSARVLEFPFYCSFVPFKNENVKASIKKENIYFYSCYNKPNYLEFYGYYKIKNILNKFFPNINMICCFSVKEDSGNSIDEINSQTKPIHTFEKYPVEELHNIYDKCFLGIRLTDYDGLSDTVQTLGLMGIKTIWNGGTPCALGFKNEDHIIQSIRNELQYIGTADEILAKKMFEFLNPDNYSYIFDPKFYSEFSNYKQKQLFNVVLPEINKQYYYEIDNILLRYTGINDWIYEYYIYHNNVIKYSIININDEYNENNTLIINIDKILSDGDNISAYMNTFGIKYIINRLSKYSGNLIKCKLNVLSNLPIKIFTGSIWINHNNREYNDVIEITDINKWRISISNEFMKENLNQENIIFNIETVKLQVIEIL